jgi:hypothetical protein
MIEIKNNFVQSKMNQDLDDRLVPSGEYRSAQNISISRAEGSDVGALGTVLGNTLVKSLETTISNLDVIGQYPDLSKSCFYIFLTNYVDSSASGLANFAPTTAKCYIYRINTDTNVTTKLVEGYFLNFSKNSPITGMNVIENLLFWTDNRNQPRKINIDTAAVNLNYYFNEDHISVAKYAPITAIQLLNAKDGILKESTMSNPSQEYLDEGFADIPSVDNPDYLASWGGDPQYLQQRLVRFSYRLKFDDGEYSIFAPFTQICFIPKQQGYFGPDDATNAYRSTIVSFMENNVSQVILNIIFPSNDPKTDLHVSEVDILYKQSDSTNVKVVETITIQQILSKMAGNTVKNVYDFKYISTKPFRTISDSQTIRVYDKVPVRSLTQEIISNRIVYGNFFDKNSPPISLNYGVGYSVKPTVDPLENKAYTQIEYPNSTLKQNRNYQVGIVLSDRFGRQSSVILSSKDNGSTDAGTLYGGSTIYVPYIPAGTNALNWPGYSLKILFDTAEGSSSAIPPISTINGYPGIYKDASYSVDNAIILTAGVGYTIDATNVPCTGGSGSGLTVDYTSDGSGLITVAVHSPGTGYQNSDIVQVTGGTTDATLTLTVNLPNPLGWYSYKIVVRQTEQDYYNVYLPGILNGYPYSTTPTLDETDEIANIVLFNDNINKVPRDLTEVGPDQRQYRSSVQMYGRVTPQEIITDIYSIQYYPGILADTVVSISTLADTNYNQQLGTVLAYPEFYQSDTNPLIGRVSIKQPIGKLASAAAGYNIKLGIYETSPVESLLDIYFETSTTGLISELNRLVSQTFVGPVGLKIGTPYSQNENFNIGTTVIDNVSTVSSSGENIGTEIVFTLASVIDGNGADISPKFTLFNYAVTPSILTPSKFKLFTDDFFYYGSTSSFDANARNFTFNIDCYDVLNSTTTQLQLTGSLSNTVPLITNKISGNTISLENGVTTVYDFNGINGVNTLALLSMQTQGLTWSIVNVTLGGLDDSTLRGFSISGLGIVSNSSTVVSTTPYRIYIKLQDAGGLYELYDFEVIYAMLTQNKTFGFTLQTIDDPSFTANASFLRSTFTSLYFKVLTTNYDAKLDLQIKAIVWPLPDTTLIGRFYTSEILGFGEILTVRLVKNGDIIPGSTVHYENNTGAINYSYTVTTIEESDDDFIVDAYLTT